jgi:hypothetical protein
MKGKDAQTAELLSKAAQRSEYRLFLIDKLLHIIGRREFEAETDQVAIALAHDMFSTTSRETTYELWSGTRVVTRGAHDGDGRAHDGDGRA